MKKIRTRNIRWLSCVALLFAIAWGCQCEAPECRADGQCGLGEKCINDKCTPQVGFEHNRPEIRSELQQETAPEPVQEVADEPLPQEPAQEPQPEPRSEPAKEPGPEPRTEPQGEVSVEPGQDARDGGTEPVPEGTGHGCLKPQDCPGNLHCVKGRCQSKPECSVDSDCTKKPFNVCLNGYCTIDQPVCKANGQCIVGTICYKGACVPGPHANSCKHHSDCPANYYCEKQQCTRQILTPPVQCAKDSECRSWERCFLTRCMRKCTTPKDCPSINIPQCIAGICVNPNLPPGTCNADSDCLPRQYCATNTCTTCKAKPSCTKDSECKTSLANLSCLNGECGVRCVRDTDCPAGFNICSQGMCRGDGYNPVGCPEDTEICDLVITKVRCVGNGRMNVTVQNVGIGPAVGRFYLCFAPQNSPKQNCQGAIIMNYASGGSVLRPRATASVTVSWRAKPGDILAVDRPNIILEASETNNIHQIQMSCP